MPYKFLEDIAIADFAVEIQAQNIEELFSGAADAFLAIQVNNPTAVELIDSTRIDLSNRDLDMLLYKFLQELVYLKDVKGWLLKVQQIKVQEEPKNFSISAEMRGEVLDPVRHEQRGDIKAVTLHGLEVTKTAGGYKATVIVDV